MIVIKLLILSYIFIFLSIYLLKKLLNKYWNEI